MLKPGTQRTQGSCSWELWFLTVHDKKNTKNIYRLLLPPAPATYCLVFLRSQKTIGSGIPAYKPGLHKTVVWGKAAKLDHLCVDSWNPHTLEENQSHKLSSDLHKCACKQKHTKCKF